MRIFRELRVWNDAYALSLKVYAVTQSFPKQETYGLVSQLRRAALSIASNIAEGAGRRGNREFAHFLQISLGSANEVDHQLLLARDLGYLGAQTYDQLYAELVSVQKGLVAFIHKVRPVERALSYPSTHGPIDP